MSVLFILLELYCEQKSIKSIKKPTTGSYSKVMKRRVMYYELQFYLLRSNYMYLQSFLSIPVVILNCKTE